MREPFRALLAAAVLLPAAHAQFQLLVVTGNTEQPVAALYDFGKVASGDAGAGQFRLRNTTNAPAALTLLAVAGTGFTLSGGPSLPATLLPQAAADFTIDFAASNPGNYSAVFRADGISAQLAATVVPGLTFQVETPAGKISLGVSVEFGSVQLGQAETLHFDIANQTGLALPVPTVVLTSGDFAFPSAVPAGMLPAGQSSGFDVRFVPTAAGRRSATLTMGTRNYALTGTGIVPDLPKPQLTITLAQPQSAQQGSVLVRLDRAATASGTGMLTLAFQPALTSMTDPAIVFASGGTTATFTFGVGDTQGSFGTQAAIGFQTGTTAGSLVFDVRLGDASDQQTVTIAPAPVGVTAAQATRSSASVAVQINGFDNTRTAAALTFTFFDTAGNPIAGPIPVDGLPAFQAYFGGSDMGGSFALRAVFPVTGDPARITSFEANIANQAGTTMTARTAF